MSNKSGRPSTVHVILKGASRVLDISPACAIVRRRSNSDGGFSADRKALGSDWSQVGRDIKTATRKVARDAAPSR